MNFKELKKKDSDITTLSILEQIMNEKIESIESPQFATKQERFDLKVGTAFKEAKRFLFNVEIPQNVYSFCYEQGTTDKLLHISNKQKSELPFSKTLYVFENPVAINWSLKDTTIGDGHSFKEHELIGILIEEKPLSEWEWNKPQPSSEKVKAYRAYLFFLEDDIELHYDTIVSWQWIEFMVIKMEVPINKEEALKEEHKNIIIENEKNLGNDIDPDSFPIKTRTTLVIQHLGHLCSDKKHCDITKTGREKNGNIQNIIYCQEYANRKAIVDVILHINDVLNNKEVIEKEVERNRKTSLFDTFSSFLKSKNEFKTSIVPLPYYDSPILDKRYHYQKEDIDIGSGTKHRFRYDVRRHPRIVSNRLIWINSHIRGSGEYIPKLYRKTSVLSIPYFWEKIEVISKISWIERIVVFAIRFYRKVKKNKLFKIKL